MNQPLPVQDSRTDGRGWQDMHAVWAKGALWRDVGSAPVVKLCESKKSGSLPSRTRHGEF